jgi:DNA-directed RNA polymerase specialized sigma24 family protein
MVMKLDLKHYTARQYAAILLRDDFGYSNQTIADILGMTESGVRYIFKNIER